MIIIIPPKIYDRSPGFKPFDLLPVCTNIIQLNFSAIATLGTEEIYLLLKESNTMDGFVIDINSSNLCFLKTAVNCIKGLLIVSITLPELPELCFVSEIKRKNNHNMAVIHSRVMLSLSV